MEIPGEGLISTAIEQVVAGVQIKVSQIEESRNREFLYQMKELEFYKSNYEKDLKGIFDYWFCLLYTSALHGLSSDSGAAHRRDGVRRRAGQPEKHGPLLPPAGAGGDKMALVQVRHHHRELSADDVLYRHQRLAVLLLY